MVEFAETDVQGTGASKEISGLAIVRGISSIQEIPKKVEAVKYSLYYLLAQSRTLDSLLLLQKTDAKNIPFNPGERDKMLNGILKTAEGLLEEDPIQAWNTIWNITYAKARRAPYGESRDFTPVEYERLNTQEFKDQQAATLARYIKCYLNPDIKIKGRERFAREDLSSHMNDTTSSLYRFDFDKVCDSLDEATREKLLAVDDRSHPLSVLKSVLQRFQEAKSVVPAKDNISEARGEMGENGEISDFTDNLIRWKDGNHEIRIRKDTDLTWSVYFDVENKSVDLKYGLLSENPDLASAIKDFKDIEPGAAEKIYQSLAKSFLKGLEAEDPVFLALLQKFPDTNLVDSNGQKVLTVSRSRLDNTLIYKVGGIELTENEIKKLEPKAILPLNISIGKAVLETWIKTSPAAAKSDLASTPATVSAPEPEAEPEPKIEATPIPGDEYGYVTVTINGYDSGCAWGNLTSSSDPAEERFYIGDTSNMKRPLKIPNGMLLEVRYSRLIGDSASIKGGNAEISISDLEYLHGKGIDLEIYRDNNSGRLSVGVDKLERGKAKFGDYIGSAGEVIARLKKTLEPAGIGRAGEKVVNPAGPMVDQPVARTEKRLSESIDSDSELKKAMMERQGLRGIRKSLFDKIRFGEYKVPEASRQQETDPVKNFIKDIMGENPRRYKISYRALRKEDLGQANAEYVYFRNYDKFRRYLRELTSEQFEKMKTYTDTQTRYPCLNFVVGGDFWNKVNSNSEFQKAMMESGLFDRIRFGEVEVGKLPEGETAKPSADPETLESQVPAEQLALGLLKKAIREFKEEPHTPELVNRFWQTFLETSIKSQRLDIPVPNITCDRTQEELEALKKEGRMWVPETKLTYAQLGIIFPKTRSYALQENSPIKDEYKQDAKGVDVEVSIDSPNRDTKEKDLEELFKSQGRKGMRLSTYTLVSQASKLLTNEYFDEGATWSRLLGSRLAGKVVNAYFYSDGRLDVDSGLGPQDLDPRVGFRSEGVKKA